MKSALHVAFGLLTIGVIAEQAAGVEFPQEFGWVYDRAVALEQARDENKLLLIVYLPSDFTRGNLSKDVYVPRELTTYEATSLGSPATRAFLQRRFVSTCRCVGAPPQVDFARSQLDGDGLVVSYFCTPQEQVLHFFVGYLSSEEFLEQARLAQKIFDSTANQPESERALIVRNAHLAQVLDENNHQFAQLAPSHWSKRKRAAAATRDSIQTVIDAAVQIRGQRLAQRFGRTWNADTEALIARLSAHSDIEPDLAHQVMSELPLANLAVLERPVFEKLTGQAFWSSPRHRQITRWFQEKQESSKSILVVVNNDVGSHDRAAGEEQAGIQTVTWKPKSRAVRSELKRFEVLQLTLGELLLLLSESNITGLDIQPNNPTRFVVIETGSGRVTNVLENDKPARLLRVLKQSRPPASENARQQ